MPRVTEKLHAQPGNRYITLDNVDDTGIEPVTPTMSILTYAVLRLSRVLTSNAFTLN